MNDEDRITAGVVGVGCMVAGAAALLIGAILWLVATFDPSRWAG